MTFVIDWVAPALVAKFGHRTEVDDQGQPFRSHGAAVRHELKMLREHYGY